MRKKIVPKNTPGWLTLKTADVLTRAAKSMSTTIKKNTLPLARKIRRYTYANILDR